MEKSREEVVIPEVVIAQKRVAVLYEKLDARKDETRPLQHLIDGCVERAQNM